MFFSRSMKRLFYATLLLLLLAPFVLSFIIRVDYYDSYDYLRNALALVQKNTAPDGYVSFRPVLLPLLECILVKFSPPPDHARRLMCSVHLLLSLISFLTVVSLFFLIKKFSSPLAALFSAVFLASNSLFVHYAPMGLVDILAALCIIWAAYFFCRLISTPGTGRQFYLLAGLFIFLLLASSCKFYFVLYSLVFSILLILKKRQYFISLILINLSFFALFFAFHLLPLYILDKPHPIRLLVSALLQQSSYAYPEAAESPADYFYSLFSSVKFPGIILIILGIIFSGIHKLRTFDWAVVAISACLLLPLLFFNHNESRYLMPVMPFAAYFSAKGALWLYALLKTSMRKTLLRKTPRFMAALLSFSLLSTVYYSWGSELLKFVDPVYFIPLQESLAKATASHAVKGNVSLWLNRFYSLSPFSNKLKRFSRADEFMYFFDTSANTIYSLSGSPCSFAHSSFFEGTILPNNTKIPIKNDTLFFLSPPVDYGFKKEYPFNKRPLPFMAKFKVREFPLTELLTGGEKNLGSFGKILSKEEGDKSLISIAGGEAAYRIRITNKQEEYLFVLKNAEWSPIPEYAVKKWQDATLEIMTVEKVEWAVPEDF
jgi:hypothetical protein